MSRLSNSDRIAREAARLFETGQAQSLNEAVHLAADALHLPRQNLPGSKRVRDHLRAMSMQELGAAGYRAQVEAIWAAAEDVMTALETALPDVEPRLVGRAARGQIDGGVTLYIRAHTTERIGSIAEQLAQFGYDEPVFETADTRFGRFDRIRYRGETYDIVITRCLPGMLWKAAVDLFRGTPIESVTIEELRSRIDASEEGDAVD